MGILKSENGEILEIKNRRSREKIVMPAGRPRKDGHPRHLLHGLGRKDACPAQDRPPPPHGPREQPGTIFPCTQAPRTPRTPARTRLLDQVHSALQPHGRVRSGPREPRAGASFHPILTIPSSTTSITHHPSLLTPSLQLDTLNVPRLFPTRPSNPQTNRLQTPKSSQVALLDQMQDNGDLGCFSLTEKLAGVSSGLVVNTTATWDASSQTFTLNSPGVGSYKNWISQVRFRSVRACVERFP